MDCKKALAETGWGLAKAVDYLRQKGLAAAAKKADRVATDGAVGAYVHPGGKIGVLGRNQLRNRFRRAHRGIPSSAERYRHASRGGKSALWCGAKRSQPKNSNREKSIYRQQALETGKPEKVIEKIVEGKMERFYSEVCLLEQSFIKDPDKKVIDVINDAIARLR